jgi:hypothetical protein
VVTSAPTDSFELRIGVTATAPLGPGDRFGVLLVDGDNTVDGCMVDCTPPLTCVLSDQATLASTQVDPNMPLVELVLRRNSYRNVCIYAATTEPPPEPPPVFMRGSVRLVGTPKIQFRYISVTQ